ncbi:aldehyde dehydrogenase family protein [bacterium]|jgi:succinylglutamic semialdehyde dehydrogenase|nr:aldehyde dehydrogenase family protein [bacterium]
MAEKYLSTKFLGNYIQGEFKVPQEINGEWTYLSPADLQDEVGRVSYSYASVDHAVSSARHAWKSWKKTRLEDRISYLKKYQSAVKKREAQIAEMIAREIGKPLWEAKTEVASMVSKVDITVNESLKLVSDFQIPQVMENTLGVCRFRAHGVMAVLGPFNFPGHLANGHIVPALLTGNTVVFKPSEKGAFTGQWMAECFHEAGLPEGVFNLIQGEKEVGRRLVVHEGVSGVLFTGSYEVGMQIKQDTLHQHWKILALEMGGKNSAIVCEDADLNTAVYETLVGAFQTSGQRCSATSRVLVHRKMIDSYVQALHARSKAFAIGHPRENPFMGPLIDQSAMDRYLKFLGIAQREGFEMVMRGKALECAHRGHYVAPSICLQQEASLESTKKSIYQQTELFAPNIAVLGFDDLEEAIEQANLTQYGLVASVFTQDRSRYEKCLTELEVGLLNWNKSTAGASSRLPFGGLKKSGNHYPTALTATQYCAYPVASLESAEPIALNRLISQTQGLNWNV